MRQQHLCGMSASTSVSAIGTSYATGKALACTETAGDAKSSAIPSSCLLGWAHIEISSISSTTSVTWFVAADSGGDVPLTEEVTTTILTGVTTAADGSVVGELNIPWRAISSMTDSTTLYIFLKGDAGTFTATGRLFWER